MQKLNIIFLLTAILAAFYIAESTAISCTQRYECQSYSNDWNYMDCISGQCACLTSQGFTGNATAASKCTCAAPKQVYWEQGTGTPYCVRLPDGAQFSLQQTRNNARMAAVNTIYQTLIYPAPVSVMINLFTSQPNPVSPLFTSTVQGRVSPLGVFTGPIGLTEYFYGTVSTGTTRIYNVDMESMTVTNNTVAIRVNLHFTAYNPEQTQVVDSYTLTQVGQFYFNDQGLIKAVDLNIINLGWVSDPRMPPSDTLRAQFCYAALNIANCGQADDPTGYYTDFNDCMAFISAKPWGTWFQVQDDSVICRFYHLQLAFWDKVHCPHLGKNGGGKCTPHNYDDLYLTRYSAL